jgi:hypothetical protein
VPFTTGLLVRLVSHWVMLTSHWVMLTSHWVTFRWAWARRLRRGWTRSWCCGTCTRNTAICRCAHRPLRGVERRDSTSKQQKSCTPEYPYPNPPPVRGRGVCDSLLSSGAPAALRSLPSASQDPTPHPKCTTPSLIPTVNGNTVRSFSTHGQQSAAQGSSTTVSRSDIRLTQHFDSRLTVWSGG